MKDQHGNKITEHEFTKDIGHRTESTLELRELFEEYAGCFRGVDECLPEGEYCALCVEDKERMQEIIQEVTKQIQSELLKEVLELTEGTEDELVYCIKQLDGDDIRKLADEKEIILN